jgi:hypothetical protein
MAALSVVALIQIYGVLACACVAASIVIAIRWE